MTGYLAARTLKLVPVALGLLLALPAGSLLAQDLRRNRQKPLYPPRNLQERHPGGIVKPPRNSDRIDPAVVSFQPRVVEKLSSRHARVAIVAQIKNIGTRNFRSSAKQQCIVLYERVSATALRPIARLPFTDLSSGKSLYISTVRHWYTSGWEFPPIGFVVQIEYDPDIRTDGNPKNDDAITSNNRKSLSEAAITAYVRRELSRATHKTNGAGWRPVK